MKKTLFFSFLTVPTMTQAYVGPGIGLSAIGSILVFLMVMGLLLAGFLWYPIKRFLDKKKTNKKDQESIDSNSDKSQGLL